MLHGLIFGGNNSAGNESLRFIAISTQSTCRAKSTQGFDLFHDTGGVNTEVRQQFPRFAGTRQCRHREFVDFDSIRAEFARDRVAQTAFEVMILNGDDGVAVFCAAALMTSRPSGLML